MPINVDWLGDGWTYYTNDEREAMERREIKGKPSVHDPEVIQWAMPADYDERLMVAIVAGASVNAALVPMELMLRIERALRGIGGEENLRAIVARFIRVTENARKSSEELSRRHENN